MTSYLQARKSVISLLPTLQGWDVYTDGIATGASPPWVVVSLSEVNRESAENMRTTNHLGKLTIRVVGMSESGISAVCDKLMSALDGIKPDDAATLCPDHDSGVYASELINPKTSTPFLMRVLSWRTGWLA